MNQNETQTIEANTPLVREDYTKMHDIVSAVWNEAIGCGADPLTLAHALAPLTIERLLMFHDGPTVLRICERQIELIAALQEQVEANRRH